MAALYEGYTLCGVRPAQNSSNSGILGIEPGRDVDHIIVTDALRSVTVYKVSDHKPTGSWAVKQGQVITCPAVFNTKSQEYVVVTDRKAVRVWKEEDVNMEKAFKATVSADVFRVLSATDSEPVVLFRSGAVRFLESLLVSPQQPIEDVLVEEEIIRWSTVVKTEHQLVVLFSTEKKGEHYLYAQRFNPNTLVKYRFEIEPGLFAPVSFSATCRGSNIHLLYLYLNGCVCESVLPLRGSATEAEGILALPRSMCLHLPLGEEKLMSGAAVVLDEAHVAVVGFPHPSAGACKDYLCIWNMHFQTLQACKEMVGRFYSQMWCYSGKLYIPHGKILSVIPFECLKSSLAVAMGKMKQKEFKSFGLLSSWTALPHSGNTETPGIKSRMSTRNTSNDKSALTVDQLIEHIKTGAVEDVEAEVSEFICRTTPIELQLAAGRFALELVSRSQTDDNFYPQCAFRQLLETQYLCYSTCPELLSLAIMKKDFNLCQIAFQNFPDIPEVVTCAYLKTILSTPDCEMETLNLDTESVIFMKALTQAQSRGVEEGGQQNGFFTPALESDVSEGHGSKHQRKPLALDLSCPVGLHKSVLLNEVLRTAYSDRPLLPHLKNLTVPQVMVFLQYLRFLYFKYTNDAQTQIQALRIPSISQVIDWVCLTLDAHFTVLAVAPEAKSLVSDLHKFTKSQVKLYAELGKIEGSLQVLKKPIQSKDFGTYSIEVIELF